MKVEIQEFVEGARKAKGLTVIIDVFRAFSVACYLFDSGASAVIVTAEVPKALELKKRYKNCLLVGERNERKIDGFDFGNSPTEIISADIAGKIIIQSTTAGTYGLIKANADIVITGSILNAGAVANYIKLIDPENVSLVAMGYRASVSAEEDLLCAEMIEDKLLGRNSNFNEKITSGQ